MERYAALIFPEGEALAELAIHLLEGVQSELTSEREAATAFQDADYTSKSGPVFRE